MKLIYQIYNLEGDKVLEPYLIKRSAEYMAKLIGNCFVVEVEVEQTP